jgi:hypothetical protein
MHPGLLIGAGFLLGSVGVKAVTSKPAKKAYVKGIVCTMKAKEEVETIVDQAKMEFDDLMAEAGYEKKTEQQDEEETSDGAQDAKQLKVAEEK